jgi:hypothetical protein
VVQRKARGLLRHRPTVRKRHQKRWPGHRGLPRPSIPSRAREKVTWLYSDGHKRMSEFWLGGHRVGVVNWSYDANGKTPVPGIAWGVRKGRPDGYRVSYEWRPNVGWYVRCAEPYVDGLLHGWAKQYTPRGKLLMASPFIRGTGTTAPRGTSIPTPVRRAPSNWEQAKFVSCRVIDALCAGTPQSRPGERG